MRKIQNIFENGLNLSKCGFTLAEVLITLGVIGVVAAMTMPTLIAHYKDQVYDSQFKKARNIISNSIRKMMADNEVLEVEYLPLYSCDTDSECLNKEYQKVVKIIANSTNTSFSDKFCTQEYKVAENEVTFCADYSAILADGTLFTHEWQELDSVASIGDNFLVRLFNRLFSPAYAKSKILVVGVDLNGSRIPNEIEKDLRIFNVSSNGKVTDTTGSCAKGSGNCGHFVPQSECSLENPSGCKTEETCKAAIGDYDQTHECWMNWNEETSTCSMACGS